MNKFWQRRTAPNKTFDTERTALYNGLCAPRGKTTLPQKRWNSRARTHLEISSNGFGPTNAHSAECAQPKMRTSQNAHSATCAQRNIRKHAVTCGCAPPLLLAASLTMGTGPCCKSYGARGAGGLMLPPAATASVPSRAGSGCAPFDWTSAVPVAQMLTIRPPDGDAAKRRLLGTPGAFFVVIRVHIVRRNRQNRCSSKTGATQPLQQHWKTAPAKLVG